MGVARRKGQIKVPPKTKPLTGEEALQIALLGTCQITIQQLRNRLHLEPDIVNRSKREYWLDKMSVAIEAIDLTIDGYVNEEFERKFEKYHKLIEGDINSLLLTYKEV